jgi:hypothetical protein
MPYGLAAVSTAAKNPAWYTNPVTAAIAGGALGVTGLVALAKSQAHHEANTFGREVQGPYEQQLAQISALAKVDPARAQEQLIVTTQDFVQKAQAWMARGGDEAKVARQALYQTPALTNTIRLLADETGLRNYLGTDYPDPTRTSTGDWLISLADLFRAINIPALRQGVRNEPQPAPPGTAPPQGVPEAAKGFLDKYGELIFGAGSILTGLIGQQSQSGAISEALKAQTDAAKYAADLQAKAASEALGLQRQMYEQGRSDTLPWLEQGRLSLYSLSDAMGLSRGPTAAGLGLPAPTPWPGHAGAGPQPQQPGPQQPGPQPGTNIFQQMAQRYRR